MLDTGHIWNTYTRDHAITVELVTAFEGEFRYIRAEFVETICVVYRIVNNLIQEQPVLILRHIQKTSVVYFNL